MLAVILNTVFRSTGKPTNESAINTDNNRTLNPFPKQEIERGAGGTT